MLKISPKISLLTFVFFFFFFFSFVSPFVIRMFRFVRICAVYKITKPIIEA